MGQTLINILLFVVMLSVIISIHEFGHFIVAKMNHVYVYEFSIGMGPLLFQKKGKETVYSIRAIPIGGYCAMAGEDNKENVQEVYKTDAVIPDERTLNHIPWYRQIAIMLAGPVMNFLLAWIIFISLYASLGYRIDPAPAYINTVSPGSPAEAAGLMSGDKILRLTYEDGSFIEPATFTAMVEENMFHKDETVVYTVERGGATVDCKVTPVYDETQDRYLIGISSPEPTVVEIKGMEVIRTANRYFAENAGLIFKVLGKLLRGKGMENLSGPIGIYTATAQEIQYGFISFLALVGVLSLNIGIMNLLPIPIFDGGRILIALIEAILRKPLSEKVKNAIMSASLGLILLLMVVVTFNDISRLFR